MSTAIMECSCRNAYQDTQYGEKKRVFNALPSVDKGSGKFRCTACGTERVKHPEAKKGKGDKEAEAKAEKEAKAGKPAKNGKPDGKPAKNGKK
jgi:hypothetical protein